MSDDTRPIVLDCGSFQCKAGFSGEDKPSVIFPAVIGRPKESTLALKGLESGGESAVGAAAVAKQGVMKMSSPMKRGYVTAWDDMEALWSHAFIDCLGIEPEYHPVLLTESPCNPKPVRERQVELLFESFRVPATYLANDGVLSMYAKGKTTGCAVTCGEGVTYAVPVYEGYAIPHAVHRMDLAGCDVTEYLQKLLSESGQPVGLESTRKAKEAHCAVAIDFEAECAEASSVEAQEYTLPDGGIIRITDECFRAPEVLFQPSLIGKEAPGVSNLAYAAITKCEIDVRREMFGSMIVSGGTTQLPNFGHRLNTDLTKLVPASVKVGVSWSSNRVIAGWRGGAFLASLPSFETMWITRADYDEEGSRIVHKKCF